MFWDMLQKILHLKKARSCYDSGNTLTRHKGVYVIDATNVTFCHLQIVLIMSFQLSLKLGWQPSTCTYGIERLRSKRRNNTFRKEEFWVTMNVNTFAQTVGSSSRLWLGSEYLLKLTSGQWNVMMQAVDLKYYKIHNKHYQKLIQASAIFSTGCIHVWGWDRSPLGGCDTTSIDPPFVSFMCS